ncbi:hypothetical protein J3454_13050 [Erythrobacter sp. NFXS35]|uniref:hypothetical protein n=1 Tax=Erythrobacter sp. NFXS35 TaxID=2818436 RepID=UPI0032DF315D
MNQATTFRLHAAALLTGFALLLTGCFMSPGKFTSQLQLTGPDSFSFTYDGEIFFLGLSKLAQMGAGAEESFTAECQDDDTFEARDCTPAEEAEQRAAWEAGAAERAAERKKEAEQMAAVMGGIDPSDPEAAKELVRLLERQRGWERVVHKGDGLFDVTYTVTGTLSHDFLFPTIEGFPATNPFVQIILRDGGQVRINAPGFAAQSGDNPMMGGMGGMGSLAGLAAMGASGDSADSGAEVAQLPGLPVMEGTFIVRLAPGMRILANNTDEGPSVNAGSKVLTWAISPRTAQAPTALVVAGG